MKKNFIISSVYLCLIISVLFYFVVNVDHFFSWWVPDELNSIITSNNSSYYQCVKNYYLYTTINRITSDLVICTTGFFSHFGKTPYLGLILVKIIFSLSLPFSVAYFLYKKTQLSFACSISFGFILVGLISIVNYQYDAMLYSLDMAIYTTANSLLIVMLSLELNKYTSKKFIIYISVLIFAACSHEVVLALCGLLILEVIYSLLKQSKYKNILLIICIYLLTSLSYFITPGYKQRLNTWPASSTFTEAFFYMLGTFKYVFNHIYSYYLIFIIIFFLGFIYSLSNVKIKFINPFKIFFYSIIYLIVVSILVGFSKTLWINIDGDIYPRMRFEFFLLFAISIFILSINFGLYLRKLINSSPLINEIGLYLTISSIILGLTIIHPDLFLFKRSIESYFNNFKSNVNNTQSSISNSLISSATGYYFFRRDLSPNSEKIGKYFALDQELAFSNKELLNKSDIHSRINSLINLDTEKHFDLRSPWFKYLLFIYNRDYYDYVAQYMSCQWITVIAKNSVCDVNSLDFNLKNIYIKDQFNISLDNSTNSRIDKVESWLNIYDDHSYGEHFIYADKSFIPGTYSLTLKGESRGIKNYIYIISKKSQILLPWAGRSNKENFYYVYGPSSDIELLYSQSGIDSSGLNFINILFKVNKDLDIQIRYQHSAESTIYKGDTQEYSKLFNVTLGRVEHK